MTALAESRAPARIDFGPWLWSPTVDLALFGGSAEYVALQLKDWGVESAFYWYVSGMIGLSLIVYVFMSDTRRTSLIDRD